LIFGHIMPARRIDCQVTKAIIFGRQGEKKGRPPSRYELRRNRTGVGFGGSTLDDRGTRVNAYRLLTSLRNQGRTKG